MNHWEVYGQCKKCKDCMTFEIKEDDDGQLIECYGNNKVVAVRGLKTRFFHSCSGEINVLDAVP